MIGFANLSSTALATNRDNDVSANSNFGGSSSTTAMGRFEGGIAVVGVVGAVVLVAVGMVML